MSCLRPALPSSLPVLYLMAPMTLYGTPALEAAREYPFHELTGCEVQVWVCEDLYRDNSEWYALWPLVRRRAAFGVFLDHLGGWVARGVYVETRGLQAAGKPVWWWNGGEPAGRFGFGPGRRGDWQGRYRKVGLGWGRAAVSGWSRPLRGGVEPWP